MTKDRQPGCGLKGTRGMQRGFSLVELMIASTLGLLILTTMISVFVSTARSRDEVDKSNRQVESGRFAVEMLREDIQLAAFYGDYMPSLVTFTTPDPCATTLATLGFTLGNVPVGIQGIDDATATPSCLTNRKSGTDILVVRRTSTSQLKIDVDENGTRDTNVTNDDGTTGVTVASLNGGFYFQSSNCTDTPGENAYVLATDPANFTLHTVKPVGTPPSCMTGGLAPIRQYMVRIFYVATCNVCSPSDNIPTLKVAELTAGGTISAPRSIAEGIENLQFEYGIDTTNDGSPDSYSASPAAAEWQNVMVVKIFLLARNTEKTPDYTDTKTYSLASDGSTLTGTPFNDQYKRHVYAATARAVNIANRR